MRNNERPETDAKSLLIDLFIVCAYKPTKHKDKECSKVPLCSEMACITQNWFN